MMHNIFSECEDPELVDLELDMGLGEPLPELGEGEDFDLELAALEADEIESLEEEMEAELLDNPQLAESFTGDDLLPEPLGPEELEELPREVDTGVDFERLIGLMKNILA